MTVVAPSEPPSFVSLCRLVLRITDATIGLPHRCAICGCASGPMHVFHGRDLCVLCAPAGEVLANLGDELSGHPDRETISARIYQAAIAEEPEEPDHGCN
jgi:hypothetical protein